MSNNQRNINFDKVFNSNKFIYSVYSGGSYSRTDFNPVISDIDLSIIVNNPSSKDIIRLQKDLEKIGQKNKIKISVCYSDIKNIKKDIKKFKVHSYGKKRSSFLYDILYSTKIYGKDLSEYINERVYFHPYEVYSNISELTNSFYQNLSLDYESYKKCINISIVIAKTTLLLKGYYQIKKINIIKSFSKSINRKLGEKLYRIYTSSKKTRKINYDSLNFLMKFNRFCNDYSRKLFEVNENEIKPVC